MIYRKEVKRDRKDIPSVQIQCFTDNKDPDQTVTLAAV